MSEQAWILVLACLNLGLAIGAAVLAGPSRSGSLMALASLVALGIATLMWADVRRARWAARAEPPPRYPARVLDQDEYAALLRADMLHGRRFQMIPGPRGLCCVRCNRTPKPCRIAHPIWDGPFDDAGSGAADIRRMYWCLACDGPLPPTAGAPVRLPYLDNLPIKLLPELYERPAFRNLSVPIALYVPPPPPEGAAVEQSTPHMKETAP
jgi:hypothetical protein